MNAERKEERKEPGKRQFILRAWEMAPAWAQLLPQPPGLLSRNPRISEFSTDFYVAKRKLKSQREVRTKS